MGNEKSDHHVYPMLMLYKDSVDFFLQSTRFYATLLKNNLAQIEEDPDIKAILGEEYSASDPLTVELEGARRGIQWLEARQEEATKQHVVHVQIEHEMVRYLKAVGLLYLSHLRNRRDIIAAKPNQTRQALQAVDQRLLEYEEKTKMGVFGTAIPLPLMQADTAREKPEKPATTISQPEVSTKPSIRPAVVPQFPIIDNELRTRCMDLFTTFQTAEQQERLDTVVVEATRILEDRLREAAGITGGESGSRLASLAFAGSPPRLRVSKIEGEQEGAHLLFKGVFQYIRNQAHHKLLRQLSPERVLQILGLIDYLLFTIKNAEPSQSKVSEGGEAG